MPNIILVSVVCSSIVSVALVVTLAYLVHCVLTARSNPDGLGQPATVSKLSSDYREPMVDVDQPENRRGAHGLPFEVDDSLAHLPTFSETWTQPREDLLRSRAEQYQTTDRVPHEGPEDSLPDRENPVSE